MTEFEVRCRVDGVIPEFWFGPRILVRQQFTPGKNIRVQLLSPGNGIVGPTGQTAYRKRILTEEAMPAYLRRGGRKFYIQIRGRDLVMRARRAIAAGIVTKEWITDLQERSRGVLGNIPLQESEERQDFCAYELEKITGDQPRYNNLNWLLFPL